MKKSSIWKLLFSALTVFAVAVFAGCTDDNDDMGAPYLNVTPENLTFDAEGQPADEYNGTFIVETNRPWRAIVEDEQTWVRLSATEGEGDAAVTVTVPASNIGQSAKVTFEVYNSYGALIQKDVNVLQGEVVPPTLIFNETAGSESVANPYPLVADYTGWNTTGEGASKVSYEGVNTSIRASGKSSAGAYDGASGPNVIFFGSAPATFTVKNITLASGQTNLKLTFGGQYYDGDNNDNNFNKDNFVVYLSANGTDYTPLSYEVNDGDQVDPYWVFATKNFTLKNATSTLYIKFEAKASSKFRLDDITLMTGNGGEEIDLAGGGVVPPDPSGDAIYENNFDKTPAEKVDNKWPFLDQTDAWQNASGTGNSTVTYTSANVSVRTSGKLSGGYDGASGSNKIFFGSAPATFDINTITMPAGKTNYRIIFGGAYSQSNGGTYDNIFKPESFHVAVGNGTDWSGNLTYEKIGGSDTTDPYWVQFAVDFTLKEAVGQLSIRFTADLASVFAIDDVQLVEGNGGQEVDLEGGTYTLIDNLSNLSAGTYLMAGFRAKGEAQSGSATEPNPAAEDYYGVWTGEMITGNGKTDCETLQMTFANGELTKIDANVTNSPAEMELVAVDGKSNTYYIKCNGQYLASGSKSRSLSLGADPAEWVFSMVDKDGESRLVAANGGCSLQTVDSSFKTMIRGYASATQGKHGIYFFKKN